MLVRRRMQVSTILRVNNTTERHCNDSEDTEHLVNRLYLEHLEMKRSWQQWCSKMAAVLTQPVRNPHIPWD